MERTLGHKIYDRYIQMYTPDYCLPNGAKHYLPSKNIKTHNKSIDIEYQGQLRDYQLTALMHVVENEGGLIEAPTGSGKSAIVMGITSHFKTSTLIVCPTKKLVKEMVDKFKEFTNYVPGTYYSDGKNIKDITITTHTSFAEDIKTKGNLKGFAVVMVDEADDKLSLKMIHSLAKCDCDILIGMSGTPDRQELDINDMQLIFGPYVRVGEYQMRPDGVTHYVYKRSEKEVMSVDYSHRHKVRESILGNKIRYDKVIGKIKEIKSNSFLTLLLVDRVEEIDRYAIDFPEALVITGSTKVKDDEIGISKLLDTGGLIIGSIKKMYRGIDIPPIDNVIIASPIKFENTVIQAVGRALRKYEGKTRVDISIINDDILKNQRYEQSKSILKEYSLKSSVIYF